MNIGDKVLIGGRTMLRPGFSLVGLQGLVMPSAPHVPANCTTVHIDWQAQGYTQTDDLPPLVNVLTEHLELATNDANTNIELPQLSSGDLPQTQRPTLGLVRDEDAAINSASSREKNQTIASEEIKTTSEISSNETTLSETSNESPPEERPRLRLL